MKYKSFEAAKIANPEEDIFKLDDGSFATGFWINKNNFGKHTFTLCHADEYCMTVEQFLKDGHKFVKGDIYMFSDGFVNVVSRPENKKSMGDSSRYILKAAALEESTEESENPKRVKYEKVKFTEAWRAIKKFEEGEKLYTKRSHKDFILIDDINDVLRFLYDLHVEKEITERDEFIEKVRLPDLEEWFWELDSIDKNDNYRMKTKEKLTELLIKHYGQMFDAGCRFKEGE